MSEPRELDIEYQQINYGKTDWFEILPAQLQSTATRTSQMQRNMNLDGILLSVVTANEAATASFTPSIKTLDAFGTVITLWTAAAAITTDTTSVYSISPNAFTNTSFTQVANLVLPRIWYLVLTYAGTPATDKIDTKASICYI